MCVRAVCVHSNKEQSVEEGCEEGRRGGPSQFHFSRAQRQLRATAGNKHSNSLDYQHYLIVII